MMGSLSNSSDFGAVPVGDQTRYGAELSGPGRWATLPDGLGVLWTNDTNSLQLLRNDRTKVSEAYALRMKLIDAAKRGLSVKVAFDVTVRENGAPRIYAGDLSDLA